MTALKRTLSPLGGSLASLAFFLFPLGDIPRTLVSAEDVPPELNRALFILDSHVTNTLEASIAGVGPAPVEPTETQITYLLDCAAADQGCKALGQFPATVTHFPGSIFEGEAQPTDGGGKFSWYCELGSGSDDVIVDQYGTCNRTTILGNGETSVDSTVLNSCYVTGHSAAAVITGGLDKLGNDTAQFEPYYTGLGTTSTVLGSDLVSIWSSDIASMSCGPEATFNREVDATSTGTSTATAGPEQTSGSGSETGSESETGSSEAKDDDDSGAANLSILSWCLIAEASVLALFAFRM